MSVSSSGIKSWLVQRVSAAFMAALIIIFIVKLAFLTPLDHKAWFDMVANPVSGITLIMFLVFLLIHSWIGLRDVVMDYLKPLWSRLLALALIAAYLGVCLVYGVSILMRVAL